MQWMNLPLYEQLDLEKFVYGHCNVLHIGKEKSVFIGLASVLPMEQKFYIIF